MKNRNVVWTALIGLALAGALAGGTAWSDGLCKRKVAQEGAACPPDTAGCPKDMAGCPKDMPKCCQKNKAAGAPQTPPAAQENAAEAIVVAKSEQYADDGEKGERSFKQKLKGSPDMTKAANPAYVKECGSCHFAYQPGFLPSESWVKLMAGLADHFGDNAELSPEDQKAITEYLTANSAEKSRVKASVKIIRSLGGAKPLRITETPYFIHEHREIPVKLYKENEKVKSLSHCNRCHVSAAEGSFNEHEVNIPGVGRWED